jgi:hypothetical protein
MIHHIDRLSSLSVCCLAWSFASTRAFSTPLNTQRLGAVSVAATSAATTSLSTTRRLSQLNVASTPTIAVADMERGVGGRIEAAFEAAKEKGEAAFVSFITAGYPTAQGTFVWQMTVRYDGYGEGLIVPLFLLKQTLRLC